MARAITRRQALLAVAAGGALRASESAPLSGRTLYADVETYSAFGEHRTGTTADRKTSHWLREQLARAGYRTRLMPFHVEQFFPRKTELVVAGTSVPVFPIWWPRPTGPSPLRGVLGGNIALVKLEDVAAAPSSPAMRCIGRSSRRFRRARPGSWSSYPRLRVSWARST